MPVHCPIAIKPISEQAFNDIDRIVMSCAFESQNTLGRLCDEHVYENDLSRRLRSEGVPEVHTQIPVTAVHGSFSKTYRLDLVVNQMVYELKTVQALAAEHTAQVIHYAALLSIDRAKLINFSTPKVHGKLIRTPFALPGRSGAKHNYSRWHELSNQCSKLKAHFLALVEDLGPFLQIQAYEEALIHLMGGEAACARTAPIVHDGVRLGTQKILTHASGVAFVLTALIGSTSSYESHLCRMLQWTNLGGIQWFNLKGSFVDIVTLEHVKALEFRG